jgi:FkbM family methyltransferase
MVNKIISKIKSIVKTIAPSLMPVIRRLKIFISVKETEMRKSVKVTISQGVSFNIYEETAHAFECFGAKYKEIEVFEEMQAFLKLTDKKTVLLDIGALYGAFSLAFTCTDPKKTAYAVEPSLEPYRILGGHIKINPGLDIKPYNIALGSHDGKLRMKYEWKHLVAVPDDEILPDFVAAKVLRLDDFVKANNFFPDVVKIDAEGSEFHILEGGRSFLKRYGPSIHLEVHAEWLNKLGVSIERLVVLIHSLGYKIYDLKLDLIKDPIFFLTDKPLCRVICGKKPLRRA